MKYLWFFIFLSFSNLIFSQEIDWIETEGTIAEITIHPGKKVRETAIVHYQLKNGEKQMGNVDLFRIPFIGSMKSVGDVITINYDKNNPAILETVLGKFLSTYGMFILIVLGIVFSIKPFLTYKKTQQKNKI